MAALLATALYGLEGGIVAAVLAVLAIVFGILKRRKDKTTVAASFAMLDGKSAKFKKLHTELA